MHKISVLHTKLKRQQLTLFCIAPRSKCIFLACHCILRARTAHTSRCNNYSEQHRAQPHCCWAERNRTLAYVYQPQLPAALSALAALIQPQWRQMLMYGLPHFCLVVIIFPFIFLAIRLSVLRLLHNFVVVRSYGISFVFKGRIWCGFGVCVCVCGFWLWAPLSPCHGIKKSITILV